MQKNNELVQQLSEAIGGEWRATETDAPIQGFTADFPKFRSDAVVGVINDAAVRVGLDERAVAFNRGAANDMPDAPREVVIPCGLVENVFFRNRLGEGMKEAITSVVSQQLSYAASMQGWMQR